MKRRNFFEDSYSSKKIPSFDYMNILKFIFLNIVYGLVAFWLRNIVLTSISNAPSHRLGNDFISLYVVHNSGVAFSLFQNQTDMIIAVSFIVIIAVAFYVVVRSAYISASLLSAFAFLTSGAILNLIDRTTYGYVIDFIKIGIIPDFPSFNFADIMIVSGVLGILNIVFKKNQEN